MRLEDGLEERLEILANEPIKCIPLTEEEIQKLKEEGRI